MRLRKIINAFTIGSLFAVTSFSEVAVSANTTEKDLQIRIRDNAPQVQVNAQIESLAVSLSPLKPVFKVNESVRFTVKGNQEFFMYLFTLDEKNNQAVLILPNQDQQGNKYPGKQSFVVPNKNIEFYSDTPGTEKVVMVASKKYFAWDTKGYTAANKFLVTDISSVKSQLKRLQVRPATEATLPNRRDEDIFVQEVSFAIEGNTAQTSATNTLTQQVATALTGSTSVVTSHSANSAAAATNTSVDTFEAVVSDGVSNTITFINTDKTHYKNGEKISIIYGADHAGWVHVMSFDGKTLQTHTSTQVNGQTIYRLTGAATYPTGSTDLVALYTKDKSAPASDKVKALFVDSKKKALSIKRKESMIFTMQTIQVK